MNTTKLGSTQKFTEIEDIVEDIVILSGGNACLIIEIQASNFSLLSQEEQSAKISAYANLLNSLSFPIQIVIRNKTVDASSYLRLLDLERQKRSPLNDLTTPLRLYQNFIEELIKVRTVLDKNFYIVIPYSHLEGGALASTGTNKGSSSALYFLTTAKASLHTKAETLHTQLERLSLKLRTLNKEELVKLFYDIYNQSSPDQISPDEPPIQVRTRSQ